MFRAITKKNGPSATSDVKGTLTALWANAGSKAEASAVHPADPVPSAAGPETVAIPDEQLTPAPAAKADLGHAAAAPPTTGGDVAIAAAPDPSPEPASAAIKARAEPPEEIDLTTADPPSKGAKEESERKRKRSAPASYTEHQLAALQAAFADSAYPSAAAKAELAVQLGLEAGQVDKWFVKQRKKQREENGGVVKRSRPSKGSGSGRVEAAALAQAPLPSGQEDGAPAAPAEHHEAEAMEVDVAAAVGAPAVTQEEAPAAAVAPAQQAAVQVADDAAAGDGPATVPCAAPAAITASPAAAPKQLMTAAAPGGSIPAPAALGAAGDAAASPVAAAAPTAPAKTPATLPTPRQSLSGEEAARLAAELEEEAGALRAGGLAPPLLALPSEPPAAREAFSDARLAVFVAAQRAPLSEVVAALAPLFAAPDSGAPLEEAVLRSRIVHLAARKSCAPKDGGSGLVDALEDGGGQHLWQWELRDQKVLPKEQRLAAQQAKRRASRVQERLGAVAAAARLLRAHAGGQASAKLCKALDALQKVKTLAAVEEEQEAERLAAADKAAAKKAASAAKGPQAAEDKARLKAEKEAAKEGERAAREAERERLRAEKEAEKEHAKAEKDAEKERAKAEKEAEREKAKADREAEKEAKKAKKTGFKNVDELKKSSNKFMAFFQPKAAAAAAATPGPSSQAAAAAAGTPARSQQPGGSQPATREQGAEGATTGKRERGFFELFLKPEGPHVRSLEAQPCRAESMDAARGQPFSVEQAREQWQQLLTAMRRRRREASAQPKVRGLPPSWARKSNAAELAQRRLDKLQESGADAAAVPTWRRKLIWFSGDSQRPPFYGSRQPSPAVGPRTYLGRDEAVDYEVMSDLEWEEEPQDASSLSAADEEVSEAAGGEEEDEADSFICADGYLSEDEGVQVEEQEGEGMQLDSQGLSMAAAAVGMDTERVAAMQQLEAALERARRAGKPLIVSRLPGGGGGQPGGTFIQGDVSLLGALAAEVLLPGVRVAMPGDPAAEAAAAAAVPPATAAKPPSPAEGGGGATAPRPSGGPGRRAERPDDLLPELLSFVQAEPRLTKDKIADAFRQAHPDRKVPKKWVHDALKDNFEWRGTKLGWAPKPAATPAAAPAPAGAAAAAAALAAAAPAAPAADGTAGAAAAAAAAAPAGPGVQADGGAAPGPEGQAGAATAVPAAGGIERFFAAKGPASPSAAPSAPSAAAPPSELRAPGRLVTTTAAGAAAASPPAPLTVPEAVSGTGDPFWRRLLAAVEGCEGAQDDLSFVDAFQPAPMARLVTGMPAAVVGALVAGMQAEATPFPRRLALLRCLEGAAQALAGLEAEAAGDNLTASQQAWEPRGAPGAASLAELCREPGLLAGLRACGAVMGDMAGPATKTALILMSSEAAMAQLDAVAAAEFDGRSAKQVLEGVFMPGFVPKRGA